VCGGFETSSISKSTIRNQQSTNPQSTNPQSATRNPQFSISLW
jgi:hypothetical protein